MMVRSAIVALEVIFTYQPLGTRSVNIVPATWAVAGSARIALVTELVDPTEIPTRVAVATET